MQKTYKERLLLIGCTNDGNVVSAINNLVINTNQSFDLIFNSIEQMAQKNQYKN